MSVRIASVICSAVRCVPVLRGEAPVLGWSQTWFEWRRVMPALAEQYTVIVPDLRGLGDQLPGLQARLMSQALRKLTAIVAQ